MAYLGTAPSHVDFFLRHLDNDDMLDALVRLVYADHSAMFMMSLKGAQIMRKLVNMLLDTCEAIQPQRHSPREKIRQEHLAVDAAVASAVSSASMEEAQARHHRKKIHDDDDHEDDDDDDAAAYRRNLSTNISIALGSILQSPFLNGRGDLIFLKSISVDKLTGIRALIYIDIFVSFFFSLGAYRIVDCRTIEDMVALRAFIYIYIYIYLMNHINRAARLCLSLRELT
jgi:hypothetical protein